MFVRLNSFYIRYLYERYNGLISMSGRREIQTLCKENVAGGKGKLIMKHLLGPAELKDKCGMYASVTIEVGAALGYHEHHGEAEAYYILSGEGLYSDNGTPTPVKPGDVLYCADGTGHGLENTGSEPLVFMALIIKE